MSAPRFAARIDNRQIICDIEVSEALSAPVFCFSLMAPPACLAGGEMIRSDGSYGEVQLPDLEAGTPHRIILAYANADYRPINRAWLPLGGYLRVGARIIELPALPAGVHAVSPPPTEPKPGLRLIPPPQNWAPGEGVAEANAFAVTTECFNRVITLAQRCNLPKFADPEGMPLSVDKSFDLAPDAYRLDIRPHQIIATCGGPQGAHYAGITLLVLRETHGGQIPCGVITDAPRFSWRGQHFDCARHFFSVDTITRLLDLMALLKLNRFHWHFSDDEAFRLEVDSAPALWQKTAFRGEGELVPGVFGGGVRAGGSYSKADAQAIIDHAQNLYIDVLPEIEFPAHALGAVRALPQTRDPDDQGRELSVQGYAENVVNPAMPATWEIFDALSAEVAALFPFGMLHLGADELPPGTWNGSPAVADLKARHGLETSDDVQGWALNRLAGTLAEQGIRTAAWEEAAKGSNGGIGHNALLFSWTGQQAGIDAAKAGYEIVMSPGAHIYLDMAHSDDPEDWGAAWAAFVSLEDTLNWTVVPDPEITSKVIGVESTFWGEFTTRDAECEAMIAPRILGVATKAWSHDEPADARHTLTHARSFCDILTRMGWAWNAACFRSNS